MFGVRNGFEPEAPTIEVRAECCTQRLAAFPTNERIAAERVGQGSGLLPALLSLRLHIIFPQPIIRTLHFKQEELSNYERIQTTFFSTAR